MTGYFFNMFPLQVAATDLWSDRGSTDQLVYLGIFLGIVVIVVVVLNLSKRKSGEYGSKSKLFSGFAVNRLARNVGLNYEQIKMLNFVFKTDEVIDREKSLVTPSLLDSHFRRTYRVIMQSSNNEQEIQRKHAILFSTRNILENSSLGTISSTRQLKDDTSLTITWGKDKLNVHVLSSNTDHLIVNSPKNVLGTQIKIPKGTKLNVLFFSKNNKNFSFETRVVGYSTMHGHPVMQLAHSNQVKFLSHRRYRRRQAVIACFMNLVYVEGNGKKQRMVVDKRRFSGTIMDISVGGCSIKTTTPVQVGARFKIEFAQGESTVAALGQVLRTNRTGINTIIHVKFLRVTQKSMNLINAFVYEYTYE